MVNNEDIRKKMNRGDVGLYRLRFDSKRGFKKFEIQHLMIQIT